MDSCILSAEKISAESLSYLCAHYINLGLKVNPRQLLAFFLKKKKQFVVLVRDNLRHNQLSEVLPEAIYLYSIVLEGWMEGSELFHLDNLIQGRFLDLLLPSMMNSVRRGWSGAL